MNGLLVSLQHFFPPCFLSGRCLDRITCTRRVTTLLPLHYVEPGHLATHLLIRYGLTLYSLTALLLRACYCAPLNLGIQRWQRLLLFRGKVMSESFATPTDCSPPGSSVCGISQARILEWASSSWSRDQTHVSCMAGGFFIPLSHPGSPYDEGCYWLDNSLLHRIKPVSSAAFGSPCHPEPLGWFSPDMLYTFHSSIFLHSNS